MKTEVKIAKRPIPYIYESYNISCFTTNPLSDIHNMMTRLVNCLVKALNDNSTLPRFIIVIPEVDLLSFFSYYEETSHAELETFSRIGLKWILNQFDRVLSIKKEELRKLQAGSITSSEPKIIWVTSLNRPSDTREDDRSKKIYNTNLENLIFDRYGHYIMHVNNKLDDSEYFNALNSLNARGKRRFWQSVDDNLEKFDFHRISLCPERKPEVHQGNQPIHNFNDEPRIKGPGDNKLPAKITKKKFFKFKKGKKQKFNKFNQHYY